MVLQQHEQVYIASKGKLTLWLSLKATAEPWFGLTYFRPTPAFSNRNEKIHDRSDRKKVKKSRTRDLKNSKELCLLLHYATEKWGRFCHGTNSHGWTKQFSWFVPTVYSVHIHQQLRVGPSVRIHDSGLYKVRSQEHAHYNYFHVRV
jgi:hypothetical protein